MKATSEIEVLIWIMLTVITFLIGLNTLKIVENLANALALESAEVVARNIGSFITLTAAAPGSITINYIASSEDTYKTSIANRIVNTELILANGNSCSKPSSYLQVGQQLCTGTGKSGIDNLNVAATGNQFTFTKINGVNGNPIYGVDIQ